MSWPGTDFELEIQRRLDEQDETIATLTAALAARDEENGLLREMVAIIERVASSPSLMDGWWPAYAEAHGSDAAWRELATRVQEISQQALTTPAPAPAEPPKKNGPCRDRQYRPSPADEHAHRNSHEQLLCDTCRNAPDTTAIYVVFDGPPGATPGRFVDTENDRGESVRAGGWIDRGDGTWALRIPAPADGEKGGG